MSVLRKWLVGVALLAVLVVSGWLGSVWSPWPNVAVVLDHCDDEALRAAVDDVREQRLRLDSSQLYLANPASPEASSEQILSACRFPPVYVREYIGFHQELISMSSRDLSGPEISPLARSQFLHQLEHACGSPNVGSNYEPEERAVGIGRQCKLPGRGSHSAAVLYRYFVDAGAQSSTAWDAVYMLLGRPPSFPFHEPPLLDRLPEAFCSLRGADGIAVRIESDAVRIGEHPTAAIVDGTMSPDDRERIREVLAGLVERSSSPEVALVADADAPALALVDLAALAPGTEFRLLLRNPDANPDDPFAPYPISTLPLKHGDRDEPSHVFDLRGAEPRLIEYGRDEPLGEPGQAKRALASLLSETESGDRRVSVEIRVADPAMTTTALLEWLEPLLRACPEFESLPGEGAAVSWNIRRY